MPSEPAALILLALAADATAARQLVALLEPVIRARVVRVLRRSRAGLAWHLQVEDRVQDIFATLFDDGGRILRSWKPERGLSLENFVGLLAERRTISALRGGRLPSQESDVTLDEIADDSGDGTIFIESSLVSRELLLALLDRLREELSPFGMRLFQLVYMEEYSVEEVVTSTGMSVDAIYAWRSRLKRLVSRLTMDLQAASVQGGRPKSGGIGDAR